MAGPNRWVQPTVLAGELVRLEPLAPEHLASLAEVGLDPLIWRWMPSRVESADDMRAWLEDALDSAAGGRQVPFAQVEQSSGRAVGSTRYLAIEPDHRRLEIGYTWIAPQWHGSGLNAEAKLLLMGHAFEVLGAARVEFKTDSRNERSRHALLAIGATEEGTFRRHMLTPAGPRDSVYFSVVAEEWPRVKAGLQDRLRRLTSS